MPVFTDQQLTHSVIGAAIAVHSALGPGLLESVYEECLAREFSLREIPFDRQKPIPLTYRDLKLECGYRLDFLIAGRLVLEIKAVEIIPAVVEPIMLTYLRLSGCRLGLLINFHVPVLKDGVRRFVWHYQPDTSTSDAETPSAPRLAENA